MTGGPEPSGMAAMERLMYWSTGSVKSGTPWSGHSVKWNWWITRSALLLYKYNNVS